MAKFIPEHIISEIQSSVDIVDVVSEVVILKKAGRNYFGLCPFHSDKDPSFSVSPEKRIFHCFGCGTGGDVFTFLMKLNGYSFPEAARILAARCGVRIPEQSLTPAQKRLIDEKTRLFKLNAMAADFFHHSLLNGVSGKNAMTYLNRRGFSEDIITRFKIGFAPEGWDNLLSFFYKKKAPLNYVEQAGLVVANKQGNGYYDRFRNRIMFPITNIAGSIIGFGGRVTDESLPKYLNTPETPVYNKSRSLYGIDAAKTKCRTNETVLIVEGYLDFLALYQAGSENTVATLGTALTNEHVRMLRGCIGANGKAVLVYDSDLAGIKAAERSIAVFDRGHIDARILVLPAGHDPDSYIRKHGRDSFMRGADKAKNIIDFLTDMAVKKYGPSVEGKLRVLDAMIGPLAAIDDSNKKSLYRKELAERLDIDESAILHKVRDRNGKKNDTRSWVSDNGAMISASNGSGGYTDGETETAKAKFERRLIAMMLQFPAIIPEIENRRLPYFFENNLLKTLGNTILKYYADSEGHVAELLNGIQDERLRAMATSLAIDDRTWRYEDCLKLINQFESGIKYPEKNLSRKIKEAVAKGDDVKVIQLLAEKQKYARNKAKKKCVRRR
ncbi:DNA primase [Desulfococcaceae bacterium HSG7]|nr:DNA primase [Desulfococcaceae bacterium HSG7]